MSILETGQGGRPSSDTAGAEVVRAAVVRRLFGRDVESPRIGRFAILRTIGAGGMGRVYVAYDEQLDRRVAIKVLHGESLDDAARLRTIREARAMAQLSHPNIVQVYEVGEQEGQPFIAMEYVEGETLAEWQESADRSRDEVLAAYLQAGDALASAHAVGFVHRDFKPHNAMVDTRAGKLRVRVLDFGLARHEAMLPSTPAAMEDGAESGAKVDAKLTATGRVLGTPAYMAPEQFETAAVGPAADQFSFCVALWEGLYGQRPFAGRTAPQLVDSITRGKIREPPREARVPTWLRTVLTRGLAVTPEDRYPSMATLLKALGRSRARARTRKVLVGTGSLALVAAAVVGVWQLDRQRKIAVCEEKGAAIEEVWNDGEREALRAGLLAVGTNFAETTADRVVPWLDAHAEAWRTARSEVCMDGEVFEVWSGDLLDRSTWCFEGRRLELEALVTRLKAADVNAVVKAVRGAAGLREVEPCRDGALLLRLPPPPREGRDAVAAVRAELARAGAMRATGAAAEGLAVARQSIDEAKGLGWPPLLAAAEVRAGDLLEATGAYEEAETVQERAYFDAVNAGAVEDAFSAAAALAFTVGYRRARRADGERWGRHADVLRRSLPDPGGLREATTLNYAGAMRVASGDYEGAAQAFERALAIKEETLGVDHPDVASSLDALGNVFWVSGAFAEAQERYQRALEIRTKVLGPDHPDLGTSFHNLANLQKEWGDYEEAVRLHAEGLAIRERALGPEHPDVGTSLHNLASVRNATGAFGEAVKLDERALAIWEKVLGPDHPSVASTLNNLGNAQRAMGAVEDAVNSYERALAIAERVHGPDHPGIGATLNNLATAYAMRGAYEKAAKMYERALVIKEKTLGPEHVDVASTLDNLGNVRRLTGANEEARKLYERALAIGEKALGPEHPDVAYPLVGLARVALVQGRPNDAVQLARRAVDVRDNGNVALHDLAEAHLMLARALVAAGESKTLALSHATRARDAYRDAGDAHRRNTGVAEAFIREHGGTP